MIPVILAGVAAAGAAAKTISDYKAQKDASKQRQTNIETARNTLKSGKSEADNYYADIINGINQHYANNSGMGTQEDLNRYKQLISEYNPEQYAVSEDSLKYNGFDKSVEDYLNPYYDKIISGTVNSLNHSAAGTGGSRGTGALANVAAGVAKKQDELYKTALNEYNSERDFDYKKFSDYNDAVQKRLNTLNDNNKYMLSMYGNMAQSYVDRNDSQYADILKAQQDKMNAQTQYNQAMAGLV